MKAKSGSSRTYSLGVYVWLRLLCIVMALCVMFASSIAKAEEFEISSAVLDFCNSYSSTDTQIIFGDPYLRLSDYQNGKTDSSYSGHDAKGLRVPRMNSVNKYNEDFFVNSLLTLRVEGDPITIDGGGQKLRYCVVLKDAEGRRAILDQWNPVILAHVSKTLLNFYNVVKKKTKYERKGSALIETISNGSAPMVLAEYCFDAPGKPYSLFYSVKGAKKSIIENAGAEWDISIDENPSRTPLDVGVFSYGLNENKDKVTSTPIAKSHLIEIRFNYAWNQERSISQNLNQFVWETKRIAAYINGLTDAQLKLDVTESALIAENPSFAEEMYCRIILKGGTEKCKEHLKYRLPLPPIVDTNWNRNIDYEHWLDVANRALIKHSTDYIDIDQILVKKLPFYDGPGKDRFLVEVTDTNKVEGKYYFIATGDGEHTWWLDGSANPIIQHNAEYDFSVKNAEQAVSYLKFFCSSLSLSGAPVYILDLEKNRFPGLEKGDSKPPQLLSSADGSWKIFAHYILGPMFSASTFTVSANGAVSMDDDQSGWLQDSGIILDKLVYIGENGLRRWSGYEKFMKDFSPQSGKRPGQ